MEITNLILPKAKRPLNSIIIHCAMTRPTMNTSVYDIEQWHKARGFNEIGYHYYIKFDGTLHLGRDLNKVGAHCKGKNTGSIGICLEGGWDAKYDYTPEQEKTLASLLIHLTDEYTISLQNIHGHNEFDKGKTCPNFFVPDWVKRLDKYLFV